MKICFVQRDQKAMALAVAIISLLLLSAVGLVLMEKAQQEQGLAGLASLQQERMIELKHSLDIARFELQRINLPSLISLTDFQDQFEDPDEEEAASNFRSLLVSALSGNQSSGSIFSQQIRINDNDPNNVFIQSSNESDPTDPWIRLNSREKEMVEVSIQLRPKPRFLELSSFQDGSTDIFFFDTEYQLRVRRPKAANESLTSYMVLEERGLLRFVLSLRASLSDLAYVWDDHQISDRLTWDHISGPTFTNSINLPGELFVGRLHYNLSSYVFDSNPLNEPRFYPGAKVLGSIRVFQPEDCSGSTCADDPVVKYEGRSFFTPDDDEAQVPATLYPDPDYENYERNINKLYLPEQTFNIARLAVGEPQNESCRANSQSGIANCPAHNINRPEETNVYLRQQLRHHVFGSEEGLDIQDQDLDPGVYIPKDSSTAPQIKDNAGIFVQGDAVIRISKVEQVDVHSDGVDGINTSSDCSLQRIEIQQSDQIYQVYLPSRVDPSCDSASDNTFVVAPDSTQAQSYSGRLNGRIFVNGEITSLASGAPGEDWRSNTSDNLRPAVQQGEELLIAATKAVTIEDDLVYEDAHYIPLTEQGVPMEDYQDDEFIANHALCGVDDFRTCYDNNILDESTVDVMPIMKSSSKTFLGIVSETKDVFLGANIQENPQLHAAIYAGGNECGASNDEPCGFGWKPLVEAIQDYGHPQIRECSSIQPDASCSESPEYGQIYKSLGRVYLLGSLSVRRAKSLRTAINNNTGFIGINRMVIHDYRLITNKLAGFPTAEASVLRVNVLPLRSVTTEESFSRAY